jgi:hypothetical protein
VDPEIKVFACLSEGHELDKYLKDWHVLTKCVFFILCCPSQTKTSIVLLYSPVHTVSKPFVHVYRQVVRASHVEIDEEALIDIVGNKFKQLHHLPCQTEPTVLGSDGNCGYVSMVFNTVTFGLSKD